MALKLYDVSTALESLIYAAKATAEENEGVIPDDLSDKIDALNEQKETMLFQIGRAYKNHLGEAEALKAEIKRLQSRAKAEERMADWLYGYVAQHGLKEGEKLSDTVISYSWRKSSSVEIVDELALPENCIKVVITKTPDKIAIKAIIKAGTEVPGAVLVEKQNLQIK
jgi:hypothetical protein